MQTIELTTAEAGQRLDRYLRKLLPAVPLGAVFKLLRRGRIRVDGHKAKPDLRLIAGMVVTLDVAEADLALRPPADQPVEDETELVPRIVHRDEDLLVVDKPAGMAVQPGSGHDHHLLAWLDRQPFGVRTQTYRPAPAHRLDRGTSGLCAIGLSPAGSRGLADAFRADRVAKVYLAIVEGVPDPVEGSIDAPLLLRTSARAHQPKVSVDDRGKHARTDYRVLARKGDRALLRLVLHTGRTHQIRAHLGHLGHVIVGDRRYGSRVDLGPGTFLLHAAELALPHPVSGATLSFTCPAPASFRLAMGER